MTLFDDLSGLHLEVTVRDTDARYGISPGCLSCGRGWPCESRVLIDRLQAGER